MLVGTVVLMKDRNYTRMRNITALLHSSSESTAKSSCLSMNRI